LHQSLVAAIATAAATGQNNSGDVLKGGYLISCVIHWHIGIVTKKMR
jgi:hypothetical protein